MVVASLCAPFGACSGAFVVLVRARAEPVRMTNWLPIKKVAAAFVGAGIVWVALRLGVNLGPSDANEAATGVVAVVVAYLVPDKRVTN